MILPLLILYTINLTIAHYLASCPRYNMFPENQLGTYIVVSSLSIM